MVKDKAAEDGEEERHRYVSHDEHEAKPLLLVLIGSKEGVLEPDPVGSVKYLQERGRVLRQYIGINLAVFIYHLKKTKRVQ